MNTLSIGLNRDIKPKKTACLFIHDEVPKLPLTQVFDPRKHSLDLFAKMTPRRARELAELFYTAVPEGANTLTVRNGKRTLAPLLLKANRLDLVTTTDDEVRAMLHDLLFLPELKNALCGTKHVFSLKPHTVILARLNRAELGDFTCLVLGFVLINMFKGQIIIPDAGFYLRDGHASLVRENRLIAGVNTLSELPLQLRNTMLLIKDKTAAGALYEDAVLLAKYKGLLPNTNEFNAEVDAAMA